jgi:hypothetical protein
VQIELGKSKYHTFSTIQSGPTPPQQKNESASHAFIVYLEQASQYIKYMIADFSVCPNE